jgi:phosphoglycerate dehydrogenase-like enzyme
VNEADLIEALECGHLAGAGLDVTEVEPLPDDSPLWELPNVLITPHVGAQGRKRDDDVTDLFCENLRRYQLGERLWNEVDKRWGFPHPDRAWIFAEPKNSIPGLA